MQVDPSKMVHQVKDTPPTLPNMLIGKGTPNDNTSVDYQHPAWLKQRCTGLSYGSVGDIVSAYERDVGFLIEENQRLIKQLKELSNE